MNKKVLLLILIATVLIAIAIFVFWKYGMPQKSNIVLFYGDGCPHCANVDEFIKENKVDEKVFFDKKEVYNNKDNAAELLEKAGKCGLSQGEVGVPFLWTGSECLVGDADIINFFQQKINEK